MLRYMTPDTVEFDVNRARCFVNCLSYHQRNRSSARRPFRSDRNKTEDLGSAKPNGNVSARLKCSIVMCYSMGLTFFFWEFSVAIFCDLIFKNDRFQQYYYNEEYRLYCYYYCFATKGGGKTLHKLQKNLRFKIKVSVTVT